MHEMGNIKADVLKDCRNGRFTFYDILIKFYKIPVNGG